MSFVNFLFSKFKAEDPLRKVANAKQQNRLANILNDITGEGCHIDKPTNAEGLGWRVVVPPYNDSSFDQYAAVNSADVPDYLEEQFAHMTAEQTPSGGAGNVSFEVIDVSGDKKIAAHVNDGGGLENYNNAGTQELRVKVKNSVEIDADALQLVGDADAPGNSQYYGTSGAGAKGFHSLADAIGSVIKVNTTQADYAPQIAIYESGGTYVVRIRSKKGYNAINAQGELQHYAGDYGAWSSIGACPDVSEIEGGTP